MGWFLKLTILLVALALGNITYLINKSAPLPEIPKETWWGLEDPSKQDKSIKPFKINIPNEVLIDLNSRLNKTRPFTPPLRGTQHQYGLNTKLLTEILTFWKTKYDWRKREKFLNQFDQFKTNIQGLDIHFIHVEPKNIPENIKIVPLLLLHGWPGSIREFYELIPILTNPQRGLNFVFEVVVPSLPGYGFSQGAIKPGLNAAEIAVVFKNLMDRLGIKKYYIQGGDWGSGIASEMAAFYPDIVKGIHLNLCLSGNLWTNIKILMGSFWPSLLVDEKYQHHIYPLSKHWAFNLEESGYMHIQATKPDTIGVALNDSPIGLASYIIEKFIAWTNPELKNKLDGGLQQKFSYEKLLDNVMIYWVTNSITTSMRLYAESMNKKYNAFFIPHPVLVPTSCANFEHELFQQTEILIKDQYTNLKQLKHYGDGGHFAAFELPETLGHDIWAAIEKFEKIQK